MKEKKGISPIVIGVVVLFVAVAAVVLAAVPRMASKVTENVSKKTLKELAEDIDVTAREPHKGQVRFDASSLYDELPDIAKYPLVVEGKGQIDLEIFSSGEKAEPDSSSDSWLIEAAEAFNKSGVKVGGKTVSVSVRKLSSGQGGDYIISDKYVPDLYSPSNEMFGQYVISKGGRINLFKERMVGNTAGVLVKKDSEYKDIDSVVSAIEDGKLSFGYTDPSTSATGMNFLITILNQYDPDDPFGEKAAEHLSAFQEHIPYVAYTTMQMTEGASKGSLDGLVSEYQQYQNNSLLSGEYDFIPFGVRHDSPLYISKEAEQDPDRSEAAKKFYNFTQSDEMQTLAEQKGFNGNGDYKSKLKFTGSDVESALTLYKKNKDAGHDIVAVFVADRSGSMDGDPIEQLKESLSNGMNYIGENAYVGLVSYSSDISVDVPIAAFDMDQRAYFQGAIDDLWASGNTHSYEAVAVAGSLIQDALEDHPGAKPMIFLLSDGYANGNYTIETIKYGLKDSGIPVYTIGYTDEADTESLTDLANVNEAATISADSQDIIYKIKSLFNSNL